MLVSIPPEAGSDFEAVQINEQLTKTYAELMQAPSVAEEAARRLGPDWTPDEVIESTKTTPISGSQLMRVEAEASDPADAQEVADAFAVVFEARAARLAEETERPAQIQVAEPATPAGSPVRPQPKLYLAVGAILSALAAGVVALLRERLADRLQIDATTTSLEGYPVLGRIPEVGFDLLLAMADHERWHLVSEPYRYLLTNLSFAGSGELRTVAVVGAGAKEGKSTCAFGLASSAEERGRRTLLVDGDLRMGTLTRTLSNGRAPGLADVLGYDPPVSPIPIAGAPQLDFLPAGNPPADPTALLSSPEMDEFDQRMRRLYDLIVFDTPPLSAGADASLIAARADAVLLVVNAADADRAAFVRAVDQLRRAKANLLGVALNRASDVGDLYGYGVRPRTDALNIPKAAARTPRGEGANAEGQSRTRARRPAPANQESESDRRSQ